MNSRAGCLATAVLLGAAGLSVVPLAPAAAAGCSVFFDVNGDGFDDLTVGVPGEDVAVSAVTRTDAGSVTIVYGDASGRFGSTGSRVLTQEDVGLVSAEEDWFGAAVATGDLNGDGCADLAIGVPGEASGAGAVVVLWGSAAGLDTALPQVLRQGSAPLGGAPEAGDGFGATLALAGSLPSGGAAALWIGAPGEDIGSLKDAGLVTQVRASTGGLLGAAGTTGFHQDSAGVPGSARSGDRLGERLSGGARTLLVGVPHKDVDGKANAGSFLALTLSSGVWRTYNQNSSGIPGSAEAGDQFGGALAHGAGCATATDESWAVGAPGENIGSTKNAGTVTLRDRSTGAAIVLQQGGRGVPGAPEKGDRFGASLVDAGTLVVGAPGEDVGSTADAGAISLVEVGCTASGGLTVDSARTWTESTTDVPDVAEPGDAFGQTLGASLVAVGAGPLQLRLVVGSPGESEGNVARSGIVTVFGTDVHGVTASGSTSVGQGTPTVDGVPGLDDGFGGAVDSANAVSL